MKDIGLLILRVFSGSFMFFGHGLQKLNMLFGPGETKFANPVGLGPELSLVLSTFAEFFCAGLLILGIFPRVSAGVLAINMFIAGIIYHSLDPFGTKEKALLFLVIFVVLVLLGAGKYSINKLFPERLQKF
jgi:putative oxidoreductase